MYSENGDTGEDIKNEWECIRISMGLWDRGWKGKSKIPTHSLSKYLFLNTLLESQISVLNLQQLKYLLTLNCSFHFWNLQIANIMFSVIAFLNITW